MVLDSRGFGGRNRISKGQFKKGKYADPFGARELNIYLNAAKNILKEGLKILNSAGTVENTGGDSNKTSVKKHKSVKPEAHLSLANG